MSTDLQQRYGVTVALPRPPGNDVLLPPDAQVLAEAAAAVVAVSVLAAAQQEAGRLITELWNAPLLAAPLQRTTRRWLDSVESSRVDTQGTEGPHG
jgi:hypothetical protein